MEKNEALLEAIFHTASDAILVVDEAHNIQMANRSAEKIFGYMLDELMGMSVQELLPERFRVRHEKQLGEYRKQGHAQIMGEGRQVYGLNKKGLEVPLEIGLSKIDMDGQVYTTALVRDISKRKQLEAELTFLATHDQLTNLYNRHYIDEHLKQHVHRAKRYDQSFSLLYMDLNQFKPINDKYGHTAGDDIIRQVAERIKEMVRESDVVARIGGDEFLVVLEQTEQDTDVEAIVSRIITSLTEPYNLPSAITASIGVSVGIAIFPKHGHDAAELLKSADNAMYAAKQSGQSTYLYANEKANA